MDREQVMEGLERCAAAECDERCPYNGIDYGCRPKLMLDALALLKEQEEAIPLEPLCKWLSHYAVCPTKTGSEPFQNINMVRVGWEKWFRGGFQEWLRMEKPD